MKRQLVWMLLAASLGFNALFALGVLTARSQAGRAGTEEGWAELFSERVGLDAQQRAVFDEIRAESDAMREQHAQRIGEVREAYWQEIVKDDPDPKVLEAYVQAAPRREMRAFRVEGMGKLMSVLRPEQRVKAAEFLSGRRRARRGQRRQERTNAE